MQGKADTLGGRLELVDPAMVSAEQQPVYDLIVSKFVSWAESAGFVAQLADGRLVGPFNTFLSSPRMSQAFLELQGKEEEYTSLDQRTRQVIILAVGHVWQSDYERYAHAAVARNAGLSEIAIEALLVGSETDELTETEQVAREFATKLTRKHTVDDELYARAVSALGENGIVDAIVLAGCYQTISSLLNTFKVPVPHL